MTHIKLKFKIYPETEKKVIQWQKEAKKRKRKSSPHNSHTRRSTRRWPPELAFTERPLERPRTRPPTTRSRPKPRWNDNRRRRRRGTPLWFQESLTPDRPFPIDVGEDNDDDDWADRSLGTLGFRSQRGRRSPRNQEVTSPEIGSAGGESVTPRPVRGERGLAPLHPPANPSCPAHPISREPPPDPYGFRQPARRIRLRQPPSPAAGGGCSGSGPGRPSRARGARVLGPVHGHQAFVAGPVQADLLHLKLRDRYARSFDAGRHQFLWRRCRLRGSGPGARTRGWCRLAGVYC